MVELKQRKLALIHLWCTARLSPRTITFHNPYQRYPRILKLFLFADDTNVLHADKNLKSLESTVNQELCKLFDWLTAIRPAQRMWL